MLNCITSCICYLWLCYCTELSW